MIFSSLLMNIRHCGEEVSSQLLHASVNALRIDGGGNYGAGGTSDKKLSQMRLSLRQKPGLV
ncbi:hypothetical protein [Pseudorhodobacter sp.]|uniref:hypothetical protein n=1 Tax=Pseudorhodobacter sp. TaxID=1934400 RepID=UPI0039E2D0E9